MLGAVGWSWLVDALGHHDAGLHRRGRHGHAGRLGELRGTRRPARHGRDGGPRVLDPGWVRSSIGGHLQAWADLLCTIAGLPPLPDGVVALPGQRVEIDR